MVVVSCLPPVQDTKIQYIRGTSARMVLDRVRAHLHLCPCEHNFSWIPLLVRLCIRKSMLDFVRLIAHGRACVRPNRLSLNYVLT